MHSRQNRDVWGKFTGGASQSGVEIKVLPLDVDRHYCERHRIMYSKKRSSHWPRRAS